MSQAKPRAWSPFCAATDAMRATLLRRIRSGLGPRLACLVEPDDVLHDTLLVAEIDRDRFSGSTREEFLAWLSAIARNRILALHRQTSEQARPRRSAGLPTALVDVNQNVDTLPAFAPQPDCETHEEMGRALSLLAELSASQRASIVLRDLLELPWHTIGIALDRSPEGARRLHRRAREVIAGVRSA